MEILIYKYLSKFYYLSISEIGNHEIWFKTSTYYGDRLINDISLIFGIYKDEAKNTIHNWCLSLNPNIDLEFYWKQVSIISQRTIQVSTRSLKAEWNQYSEKELLRSITNTIEI